MSNKIIKSNKLRKISEVKVIREISEILVTSIIKEIRLKIGKSYKVNKCNKIILSNRSIHINSIKI